MIVGNCQVNSDDSSGYTEIVHAASLKSLKNPEKTGTTGTSSSSYCQNLSVFNSTSVLCCKRFY